MARLSLKLYSERRLPRRSRREPRSGALAPMAAVADLSSARGGVVPQGALKISPRARKLIAVQRLVMMESPSFFHRERQGVYRPTAEARISPFDCHRSEA